MWTKLHWVDGPWPGKLALAARPRGGEWLSDEMAHWRQSGIDTVVSLLTAEEDPLSIWETKELWPSRTALISSRSPSSTERFQLLKARSHKP